LRHALRIGFVCNEILMFLASDGSPVGCFLTIMNYYERLRIPCAITRHR
jgi:hypothetical protein